MPAAAIRRPPGLLSGLMRGLGSLGRGVRQPRAMPAHTVRPTPIMGPAPLRGRAPSGGRAPGIPEPQTQERASSRKSPWSALRNWWKERRGIHYQMLQYEINSNESRKLVEELGRDEGRFRFLDREVNLGQLRELVLDGIMKGEIMSKEQLADMFLESFGDGATATQVYDRIFTKRERMRIDQIFHPIRGTLWRGPRPLY